VETSNLATSQTFDTLVQRVKEKCAYVCFDYKIKYGPLLRKKYVKYGIMRDD